MRSIPWMLFAATFGLVLIGAVMLVLITDNWWLLPLPLAVHFVVFWAVLAVIWKALDQQAKPGATEEAKLDEEGPGSGRARQDENSEEPKPVI